MDKDSMNTESTEYSKSGSDAQSAHSPSAFDPNNTSPEGQMEADQIVSAVSSISVESKGFLSVVSRSRQV